MTAKSSACVVVFLASTCNASYALAQTGWSLKANYGYTVFAHDDYQQLFGNPVQAGEQSGGFTGANGVVDFGNVQWTAKLESDIAFVTIGVQGKVGSFHLYTTADAQSYRSQDPLTSYLVNSKAVAGVDLTLKDQVTFHSKKPGFKLITAKWVITNSSSTTSDAFGVVSPHGFDPNGNHDNAVGTGEAWFTVTGTGIPSAPAFTLPSGTQYTGTTPWAYNWTTSGGIQEPTIRHLDFDSPASIPVTFEVGLNSPNFLSWVFSAGASARSDNFDNDGGGGAVASGDADYGHTIEWGGITSVIDETTGLPDTDWSIESASGFDYAHPAEVPEPGSLVLFAIGSAAALASVRRKVRPSSLHDRIIDHRFEHLFRLRRVRPALFHRHND
jgi:hypothetical protein